MIKSLYEKFQHWSNTGSIYLISDPHFNDKDTLNMNSNWISIKEHIDILNTYIKKSDTLICLGDCGDLEYIKQIKSNYKILIKGNHDDKGNYKYKRNIVYESYNKSDYTRTELLNILKEKYPNENIIITNDTNFDNMYIAIMDNKLFDEVYDGPLFISDKILLSHEPIYGLPFCVNIHGHVHNGVHKYLDENGGQHINIASDVVSFLPIDLGMMIKNGILSNIPNIHRIAIDKAIKNPIKRSN